MSDKLIVRQSYHGTGSSDGYVWKILDEERNIVGELDYFSSDVNIGSVCRLNEKFYMVKYIADSKNIEEHDDEVIYFTLERWDYEPDFELKLK